MTTTFNFFWHLW